MENAVLPVDVRPAAGQTRHATSTATGHEHYPVLKNFAPLMDELAIRVFPHGFFQDNFHLLDGIQSGWLLLSFVQSVVSLGDDWLLEPVVFDGLPEAVGEGAQVEIDSARGYLILLLTTLTCACRCSIRIWFSRSSP